MKLLIHDNHESLES